MFLVMRRIKFVILLSCLFISFILHAQLHPNNDPGVHVSGGYAYQNLVSSNIGTGCAATGANSLAGGCQSIAGGANSFAFGRFSRAAGNAFALGCHAVASDTNSFSLGFFTSAGYPMSMVIGSGYDSIHPMASQDSGLLLGMGSTLPTLFLSPAGGLTKTGNVAIGNVDPKAKLHIRSDEGDDAVMILEPGAPSTASTVLFLQDDYHSVTVDPTGTMTLVSEGDLDIASSNFNASHNEFRLGLGTKRRFTMTTDGTPAVYSNAHRENGALFRDIPGTSYAMEFGTGALVVSTAVDQLPRGTQITNWRSRLSIGTDGAITLTGKVGINVENTLADYALAVDGGLITTKVHIEDVNNWPDYVFGEGHGLMSPSDLKAYVGEHRHLPGVPSEAEVREHGYDVAEMQALLLEKVEELTLHMLRQQEEIDSLKTLVTVRFGYDDCGNRTSRSIEFSKADGDGGRDNGGNGTFGADEQWRASLRDSFAGAETLLFPNPTEGGFVLSFAGGGTPLDATAMLCTADGKVIERRTVTGATEEFDLSGRAPGIYLLRLTSGRETRTWKVVKRN